MGLIENGTRAQMRTGSKLARMKQKAAHLPIYVPAASAIARESAFQGTILVERLPRLVESLTSPDGTLDVELQLGSEMARPPFLRGHVRGNLRLQCQRCLEDFSWPLDAKVDLRLVENEADESRWLQDYEPYLLEDDRLPLHAIVEDEVLLALPLSPRCPTCERAEPLSIDAAGTA